MGMRRLHVGQALLMSLALALFSPACQSTAGQNTMGIVDTATPSPFLSRERHSGGAPSGSQAQEIIVYHWWTAGGPQSIKRR